MPAPTTHVWGNSAIAVSLCPVGRLTSAVCHALDLLEEVEAVLIEELLDLDVELLELIGPDQYAHHDQDHPAGRDDRRVVTLDDVKGGRHAAESHGGHQEGD